MKTPSSSGDGQEAVKVNENEKVLSAEDKNYLSSMITNDELKSAYENATDPTRKKFTSKLFHKAAKAAPDVSLRLPYARYGSSLASAWWDC